MTNKRIFNHAKMLRVTGVTGMIGVVLQYNHGTNFFRAVIQVSFFDNNVA